MVRGERSTRSRTIRPAQGGQLYSSKEFYQLWAGSWIVELDRALNLNDYRCEPVGSNPRECHVRFSVTQ